jgi:hypothetical protein
MAILTAANADKINRQNPTNEEVQLGTSILETQTYAPVIISYAIASDVTTATAAFTAPFAMVIDRIDLLTTVGEASNTIQVLKATTQMCTALVATTAKAITSMAAGVESAEKALVAGDVVNVKAAGGSNGANQRGIITFIGHRV